MSDQTRNPMIASVTAAKDSATSPNSASNRRCGQIMGYTNTGRPGAYPMRSGANGTIAQ